MSSSSDCASSPEVITLDETAQEIVELDQSKPNLDEHETIDISNEISIEDDSIKILDPARMATLETLDTVKEQSVSSPVESPKNDDSEQDTKQTLKIDEQDSGAKLSLKNDDQDVKLPSKNDVEEQSTKTSLKNKNEDENSKASSKNCDQDESAKPSTKNKDQDESKKSPLIKVVFREDAMFQKSYKKIESFLKILLAPEVGKNNMKFIIQDSQLEVFELFDNSSRICLKRPLEVDLATSSNDALFTLDLAPLSQEDIDEIPKYAKKYKTTMEKPADVSVEGKSDCCPKLTCFNCMGNHNLRDCDQPKNYGLINKNRKEFASKKGPAVSRYHLEDDQKYDHLVPGQIGENLRRALGLKENSLPKHIYRMRRLGYPPGWMEEARLQHSGLALFDSEGVADDGSDEEGEIVVPGDKDKFDINKIIDFPGFNVPTPEGVHDEELNHYWGSLVQQNNSKEAMLSYLSSKKADDGYTRKKLLNPVNTIVRTDVNPGEMDVEEVENTSVECLPSQGLFIPPLPKDNIPPPPPPEESDDSESQSPEDVPETSNVDDIAEKSRETSPSLTDLEYKKSKLLAELKQSQSTGETSNASLSKSDSLEMEGDNRRESITEESEPSNSPKAEESNVDSDTPKTPVNGLARKSTISVHVGTPILHSVSPFKRLPSAEKFSKDICDVINFENLPDSTGKYDQMTELLQKVRNTLRKE